MRAAKHKSIIVQFIYDSIAASKRDEILRGKKSSFSADKERIRLQCFIPKEVYVALSCYGALQVGESEFFTHVCVKWLEDFLKEKGLLDKAMGFPQEKR